MDEKQFWVNVKNEVKDCKECIPYGKGIKFCPLHVKIVTSMVVIPKKDERSKGDS